MTQVRMRANSIPAIEIGMMLCRTSSGALTRGAIGVGTPTGVQFPDVCPTGTKIAGSVHTHPKSGGGSILPSAQDMREAKRIAMPHLCIVNDVTQACYKVRGVEAKQGPLRPRLALTSLAQLFARR